MLVADDEVSACANLLVYLEAGLLGVGILHVRIHRREADAQIWRNRSCRVSASDVGEGWRSSLSERERKCSECGIANGCAVVVGLESVGECAQRNTVVEEAVAAAHNYRSVSIGRPCESEAWREIVRVG